MLSDGANAIQEERHELTLEELEAEAVIEVPGREILSVVGVGLLPTGVSLAAGLLPDGDLQSAPAET